MMPVILNTAEPMVKVRVITTKDYSEEALKTLHRLGVLHVEESEELQPIDRAAIEQQRREVSELATCVESVLAYVAEAEGVSLGQDVTAIYLRTFDELETEVRSLCDRLNRLHHRTIAPSEEVKRLVELKGYLGSLAQQTDLGLRDLNFRGDYLFSGVFVLPSGTYETSYDRLSDYVFVGTAAAVGNETVLHVIAKAEGQKVIESVVTDAGGRILELPDEDLTLGEFLEVAEERIQRLEKELERLYGELQTEARENLERIVLLREVLSAENERLSVLEKASEAKYVTLTQGWIPQSNIESTISEIKDSIDYVFIDTRSPEQTEEPPTKLRNPKGFKPFEVIVNLFGIPRYREWDPTPVISYSFAIFFGLMVGDVVYALCIILAARFILPKFVQDPHSEGLRLFQRLLYITSGVALVLGLLTGTYLGDVYTFFGIESLALVAGIEQAIQDPVSFIILALVIGIVHVNVAHMMALVKAAKEGQKALVANKVGILTVQIFGIPYLLHSLLNVDLPILTAQMYTICGFVMVASLVVIIASSIIQSRGVGAIIWLFDLTGILGDIMSYARLAGVGLATFYLASSFNMLAGIFYDMIPGIFGLIIGVIIAIVVFVFGHSINLLLSGLTGFIHSLRLCFVEFLTKFYEGGGREYSPFKLKTRAYVPITGES